MTDAFISFEHTGYTFDTNVIIYYLKGDTDAVSKVEEVLDTAPVYVSTMTELELFSSPHSSFEHLQLIESLLAVISIIPVESRVARLAGSVRAKTTLKSPDAAIAATALFTGTTLLTRNVKDFRHVTGLSVQAI